MCDRGQSGRVGEQARFISPHLGALAGLRPWITLLVSSELNTGHGTEQALINQV
ncbi:mCG148031 [Mus musculus]|nr:mCG148031 [Mus musculus]